MMALDENDRAVLRSAADLIESGGWTRNHSVRGTRHCASGAIYAVLRDNADDAVIVSSSSYIRIDAVAISYINDVLGKYEYPTVQSWNDECARSGKQVAGVLRKVADWDDGTL